MGRQKVREKIPPFSNLTPKFNIKASYRVKNNEVFFWTYLFSLLMD